MSDEVVGMLVQKWGIFDELISGRPLHLFIIDIDVGTRNTLYYLSFKT